jgi:hypothetical protein
MSKLWMSAATTLMLAGCGGAPSSSGNKTATPATVTTSSGFNATDACATLPKEKVAAVTGLTVESATLSAVVEPREGTAGFSTCTYNFADRGSVAFFARQSPTDDNTPEAVARSKQELVTAMDLKIVDVPGLGTAAFSSEQMHQLHVFFDGNKYIYFMTPTPPTGKPIGEIEMALAKAVIG